MLQVPLEIAFHNVDPSEWSEREIRAKVDKLERLFNRLVSVRVRVDRTAKSSGTPPVVRIEMGLPGHKDLVVSHEPEHLQQRFQTPDLHNAINEAFRIAERRLVDWKEQMKDRPKIDPHDSEQRFHGSVAELYPEEDYGHLITKEGGLLYFHRNSLLAGDFDKLEVGDEIHYVEKAGDTGPTAAKVWRKTNGA